jgi:hypothetical protein
MIKTHKTVLELFGSPDDPEVRERITRLKRTGHTIITTPRPDYDSGVGLCGKHLCGCQENCEQETASR